MTDKAARDAAGYHQPEPTPGYAAVRLPYYGDGTRADMCQRCGALVGSTDMHTAEHNRREQGMMPHQLFALADTLRGSQPAPSMGQDPGQYLASLGVHSLADALVRLADEMSNP